MRFGFCHKLLIKLPRAKGKKNKKALFWENYLHFQIFETFGNLIIDFIINVSKSQ